MLGVILPVSSLDVERLNGVGYESVPDGFEDKPVRGVLGFAMPEVFFFVCLNRDWALLDRVTYCSYSSDDCLCTLRRVGGTGMKKCCLLVLGGGGVTSFASDRLVWSLGLPFNIENTHRQPPSLASRMLASCSWGGGEDLGFLRGVVRRVLGIYACDPKSISRYLPLQAI